MDEGGSHPCLELGDGPEHELLRWLGGQAKDGMIRLGQDKVFYRAEQSVSGVQGVETFNHLEDAGYVDKVRVGESYRYCVLVFCTCPRGNPLKPPAALRREPMLGAQRRMGEQKLVRVGKSVGWLPAGVKSESVQKPVTISTVYLSKFFFPQVARQAGIRVDPIKIFHNGPALASHLNRWKTWGIDLETMKLMMEEFARHPDWCRRSRSNPWRVFVAKREDLAGLIAYNRRKDPANRRWSTGTDWIGRHTLLVDSPA